ncbi:unannotated protein [freshwater metagenome]|uniref:Unannotated protein n=1 Tax=freshwater metagenome TaxID=449393 RepID=A0A6J7C263_9ZZZZ
MLFEHPMLFGGRQPREQRENLGVAELHALKRIRGIADLPLTREKHQDVARALRLQRGDRIADGLHLISVVVVRNAERLVTDLHGKSAPGHFDDRRAAEVLAEPRGVDRRRRDHDPEVWTTRQDLLEIPEQEVNGETSFMGLVNDDRVVAFKETIIRDRGEQDAVGHHLHERAVARVIGEAHLVSDRSPDLDAKLFGHPIGNGSCRDPSRLRVADLPSDSTPEFQEDLG